MKNKKWLINKQSPEKVKEVALQYRISELVAKVLISRGIESYDAISNFLNLSTEHLHSPFLLEDMQKAVDRIKNAIANQEKITIYGDYDVDGITSVSLLYKYFSSLNVNVSYYIPERIEEGYGINKSALAKIKQDGTTLLITVDSGITAAAEIEYAKEIDLDVIITDHHECKEIIPSCVAIINPKLPNSEYPYKCLAGVGVAFKLVCALEGENSAKNVLDQFSDIVAIGTVADVMPILDENRMIVSEGLKKLNSGKTSNGIKALICASGLDNRKLTAAVISFIIAPRINAAGRVDSAKRAVELFLEDDYQKAALIAEHLCTKNRDRQDEESLIFRSAEKQLLENFDFEKDRVIVLHSDGWHHGIIGIVSSRLADKYNYPCVLISTDEEIGKGSCRSIKGFNLFEALEDSKELLIKYGGHSLAAGLTISLGSIKEFREKINTYAREKISEEDLVTVTQADCEIDADDVTIENAKALHILEPYGVGNATPVFMLKGSKIMSIISLSEGKHTKLLIENKKQINAIYFGKSYHDFAFSKGDYVDILFNLDVNSFRGSESVQLIVKDVCLSNENI